MVSRFKDKINIIKKNCRYCNKLGIYKTFTSIFCLFLFLFFPLLILLTKQASGNGSYYGDPIETQYQILFLICLILSLCATVAIFISMVNPKVILFWSSKPRRLVVFLIFLPLLLSFPLLMVLEKSNITGFLNNVNVAPKDYRVDFSPIDFYINILWFFYFIGFVYSTISLFCLFHHIINWRSNKKRIWFMG
jgi:hypothetical protein